MLHLVLALALQTPVLGAPQTPLVAPDGRIAVAARGALFVMDSSGGNAIRVTGGQAWDRDPAWSADGNWLFFASDRAGQFDIWRVRIGARGAEGDAERLTTSPDQETEPAPSPDGSVVFVRGAEAAADLWVRDPAGAERRLTDEPGPDRSPAVSVKGQLAWVAERNGQGRVRVRATLAAAAGKPEDRELATDGQPTRLAWSPDGQRLAYGARGRHPGVFVMPDDGRYTAQASEKEGSPAWSLDGAWLLVADGPPQDVGYNGDPDRLPLRDAAEMAGGEGALRRVRAPLPPEDGTVLAINTSEPRASVNAEAFDRVWERVARLYFHWNGAAPDSTSNDELRRWRDAARRHRGRALAAADQAALDAEIQALLDERPPAKRVAEGRAAVASAHPLATAAGIEILQAGGNAVDAAVAVSFALGVVEPDASGMGGYGEAVIFLRGMADPTSIEFMTRVPEAATPDNPALKDLPSDGPRLVNVPGTVAGMGLAWKKYGSGRVPWARLLEPAIRIAEHGWVIDESLATTLRREWESFAKYEGSRALFFRGGRPLQPGDTLRNPDLARTLRAVAEEGADGFYHGDIARRLVADLSAAGNPIALSDMEKYYAAERRPVSTTYRGHTVYSGPPPVTGGVSLVAKLNLLELAQPGRSPVNDATELHAMIEAWKLQPSTAGRISDPDMYPVDVTPFESKDTARARWQCFDPQHAGAGVPAGRADAGCHPSTSSGSGADNASSPEMCDTAANGRACRSTGTTAFSVVDAQGDVVSVTQTLGTWGGNFYVSPGLGFLYNDKFTMPRAGRGGFGGSAPLARVGTVIAPSIVFDGIGVKKRPLLAVGAAGNAWITSAVYETVVGVLDLGLGPQEALELPRFLPGGRDSPIQIEDGFAPAVLERLEQMGHRFRRISLRGELRMGYGSAILIQNGHVTAAADPRRSGAAEAIR